MLITCPSCQANYTVADEKVRGRSLTVRCRSCQASINLARAAKSSPPPPLSAQLRAAAPAPAPRRIDEASQMFTLAALVGRATGPQGEGNGTKRASLKDIKKESSGVIDLNALARAAEERAKRAQSEPPPSAFAREARSVSDDAPPAISRKLRFAAIAAAAGVLAIVGIVVASAGGEEPKARVAVATQSQEAPKAEPAPTPPPAVATPAPAPVAASTSAQDDATPARAPKHGGKWSAGAARGKGKNASMGAPKMSKVTSGGFSAKTSTPAAAPAPKAKPTAASDPCGCKGNLQCAIKCFK